MAKPAQSTLSEQRVYCGDAGTGKNLSIGHFFPPAGAKDAAKILHVETVHLLLLLGIGCPAFTSLQEGADYACVIHYFLGWNGQLGVLLDVSDQFSRVLATLSMGLLISASKDKLSLMVEPR